MQQPVGPIVSASPCSAHRQEHTALSSCYQSRLCPVDWEGYCPVVKLPPLNIDDNDRLQLQERSQLHEAPFFKHFLGDLTDSFGANVSHVSHKSCTPQQPISPINYF